MDAASGTRNVAVRCKPRIRWGSAGSCSYVTIVSISFTSGDFGGPAVSSPEIVETSGGLLKLN